MILGYLSVITYSSTYLPSHIQSLFFTVSMDRTNGNIHSDLNTQPTFLWLLPPQFPLHPLPTPLFSCLLKTHQHVKLGQPSPQSRPRHQPNPRNTSDATVNILILKKSSHLKKIPLDSCNKRISKKCFLETFISNGLLENGKLQTPPWLWVLW